MSGDGKGYNSRLRDGFLNIDTTHALPMYIVEPGHHMSYCLRSDFGHLWEC
jgi:hypothetical protein